MLYNAFALNYKEQKLLMIANLINDIKDFLNFGISPTVKIMIVGILLIISLLFMRKIVKIIDNDKVRKLKKFWLILLCVLFIYLAVFVATA